LLISVLIVLKNVGSNWMTHVHDMDFEAKLPFEHTIFREVLRKINKNINLF
jgi:hypothetical protein